MGVKFWVDHRSITPPRILPPSAPWWSVGPKNCKFHEILEQTPIGAYSLSDFYEVYGQLYDRSMFELAGFAEGVLKLCEFNFGGAFPPQKFSAPKAAKLYVESEKSFRRSEMVRTSPITMLSMGL